MNEITAPITKLRCSSLDALWACGPSVLGVPGSPKIDTAGDAALQGKVVHALMADFIDTGRYEVKAECNRVGFEDEEAVTKLMGYGVYAWGELARHFPTPKTERALAGKTLEVHGRAFQVTGTVDVLSPLDGDVQAIFADFKTGFAEGYAQQMNGYAYLIWDKLGRPKNCTIRGVVVFMRHRYIRTVTYTTASLEKWENDLTHNILGGGDAYKPGDACNHCRYATLCPARNAIITSTIRAMIAPQSMDDSDPAKKMIAAGERLLSQLTTGNKNEPEVAELVTALRARVQMAENVGTAWRSLLRSTVERVGPIPLANGSSLALRDVEADTIDPAKALGVLRRYIGDEGIMAASRVSLPKVLNDYASRFTRGEKGKARDKLRAELEAAGAINVTVQRRLEEVDLSEVQDGNGSNALLDGPNGHQPSGGTPLGA